MTDTPDRILTTHTGSLPRPDDLIQIMWAVGDGIPVDQAALSERVSAAVEEVVDRQIEAGISVVNDGEMSKPSYATYVKDRLNGFGGESVQSYHFADLVDFPRSAEMVSSNPGRRKRAAPACNGPISVKDAEAARIDMVNLSQAAASRGHRAIFSSAASPGVVSLFFGNEYYGSDEEYVFAIAEAMRHEYEAIAEAGGTVQLDCPDLAMGRHSAYADMDREQFRRHRAALTQEILRPDKNLWERAEFYWQSIAKKQYDFEGRTAMADAVEALTLESWLAYFNRVFLRERHSLQVVAPGARGALPAGAAGRFDSAEAIKAGHDAYLID